MTCVWRLGVSLMAHTNPL